MDFNLTPMPGQQMTNRAVKNSSIKTVQDILKNVSGIDQGDTIAPEILGYPIQLLEDYFVDIMLKMGEAANLIEEAKENPIYKQDAKKIKVLALYSKKIEKQIEQIRELGENLDRLRID